MPRIPALLLGLTLGIAAHAQQTVVIPSGFATNEGTDMNSFPWGRGGLGLRHQCVYDSSHFTSQGINNPIQITGLKWRPNTGVGLAPSSYPSGCSVHLSTCPLDQAAVVNNFAGNRGADYTSVFSGPVSWGAQAAQTGPCPFGISIPLQTPFVYDPTLGALEYFFPRLVPGAIVVCDDFGWPGERKAIENFCARHGCSFETTVHLQAVLRRDR